MAAFTPGNIVVYRVGTGAAALGSAATATFLDEYTTAGILVQSIAMPTADSGSNQTLTNSGSSTAEGLITRSEDGRYIMVIGYDAAPGTASVSATTGTAVNRVVARVDANGVVDTTTAITAFSGGSPRSVTSEDGSNWWAVGATTGVVYGTIGSSVTTTISTTSTNLRAINIFDDQLYVSSGAGSLRLGEVGDGTPTTSGQTITTLPGFPTSTISPHQFFFADLTAAVAGVDTLYVTDDRSVTGGGGLYKYSLVDGAWVSNGVVAGGLSSGLRGLTASVSGTSVSLFATDAAATSRLVSLTDAGGYNAAFSTTTFSTLATAATNTAFRSVAFAPQAPAPATPTLSISDVSQDESTGIFTFTVTLSAPAGPDGVTFDIATADGTAFAGSDYLAKVLTGQTILAGQSTYQFQVQVTGDADIETNETFFVNVTNVVGATVADGQGQGTIVNDDSPGTISIADVSIAEGDSGTTAGAFTLTRSGGTAGTVTVDYAITLPGGPGGADSSDVTATLSGTVTFLAGETTATIPFSVNGDVNNEPNETFSVALSNPTGGATITDGDAIATITNDDAPPAATIADAAIAEGREGVTYLTFTVTLSKSSPDPVTIDYATSNGTATAGSDYLAVAGTVSFAAGETVKTITVPIVGDAVSEANETLTVTLSNPSGATLADGVAIGTITNDDGPAYYSLASGSFTEDWTDIGRITQNDNWSGVPFIIGYLGDYTTGTPAPVDARTLTAASTLGQVDVIANEVNTNASSGGVAEFHIANPTIGIQGSGSADAPSIVLYMDSSGRTDIRLQALLRDLDGSADNAVQQINVQYRTDANGDWINVPGGYFADVTTGGSATQTTQLDVTLPAGANNVPTLQIRIMTTNATGSDEWVGIDDIVVSSAQSASSYSIGDAAVFEGTGGTTPISFTVTRAGDASEAGTVDYLVSFPGGGFSANAADFASPLSGTVNFAAGETSKTIPLLLTADAVPEGDETFTVTLSNASGQGLIGDAAATGTIVNDDGAPALVTITDVTQAEGNAGATIFTFTVTRTGGTGAFTLDYGTVDGTASSASDYVGTSGTLSFAAGENSKTIQVEVLGDGAAELAETFRVLLSNPVGAVLADDSATGTIQNDDLSFIHQIQGSSYYSPLLAAEGTTGFNIASQTIVIVQAVVTAIDNQGTRQGFYITEETGHWDGSLLTSEGIFVMTRDDSGNGVEVGTAIAGLAVGDLVTVNAKVMEYQAFQSMPRTMLVNPSSITIDSSGHELPTLVLDGVNIKIPNSIMTLVTPDYTDSQDDPDDTFDASLYALSFWETVEGMLVTVPDMVVADGFVSTSGGRPIFQAYSLAHADADQVHSRGGYTVAGDPPNSPPDTPDTEDGTIRGGRHLHDGDVNPDIIEIDFSGFATPPPAGLINQLSMGDRLGNITGIVEFDFTDRKIFVTDYDGTQFVNTQPARETTTLGSDGRSLTVATFNVENLDPGDGQARFDALAGVIATNMNAPDIIIVEEIQDNNGTAAGTTDASITWQMLVDALNARVPGANYQWVDQEPVNNAEGGAGNGNIRVGFLYNTNRVQLGDLPADAPIEERRKYTDRIGDGVRDAGDLIAFSDDMVASEINTADWTNTRKSLLGQFTFNGNTVFVIGNHFTAKGGSGEFWQVNQNIDAGQPNNSGFDRRVQQAEDVWHVMNLIETSGTAAGVISGGDYNDFYFYRPLEVVTGHVETDGTPRVGGARFDNLTLLLPEAERYTYTFDGRSQALDHIVASRALAAGAAYDVVHINTGYNALGTGADTSLRLSDHDPAVSSFDFRSFAETIVGTNGADTLEGFGGNDRLQGLGGADTLDGGAGVDTAIFSEEAPYGVVVNLTQTLSFPANGHPDATRPVGPNEAVDGFGNYDSLISIENVVTGEKDDFVYGSDGANRIETGGGDDFIDGFGGADTMIGGTGNDVYVVDDAGDAVIENPGEGVDRVETSLSTYVLPGNVENLTATGGDGPRDFRGNSSNNVIVGSERNDIFRLQDGGEDFVSGLGGRDVFYFGAAFTAEDTVLGGEAPDILILQGDYSGGVTLGGAARQDGTIGRVVDIGSISLFPGSLTSYGDTSGAIYSYNITSLDENVAAGQQLRVNGSGLQTGENLRFDGSAETDGYFLMMGGRGTDTFIGGAGNDNFFFGHGGQFTEGDTTDGGAGYDVVYFRGDYAIDFLTSGGSAATFANVESIALLSFANTQFASGGDGEFDYSIVWADAMLAAGRTMTINGSRLGEEETMTFDGRDETDGAFRIFGGAGADVLRGGAGNDLVFGGLGADTLEGGGGNDVFRYQSVAESTADGRDGIQDFSLGDVVDLSRIDADALKDGDQAFTFIGTAAFSGQRGELRFENEAGNIWKVQGDVDGDGVADLEIFLVLADNDPITASDFML